MSGRKNGKIRTGAPLASFSNIHRTLGQLQWKHTITAATTCSKAIANSSGLKDLPSLASFRGVTTLYHDSIDLFPLIYCEKAGVVLPSLLPSFEGITSFCAMRLRAHGLGTQRSPPSEDWLEFCGSCPGLRLGKHLQVGTEKRIRGSCGWLPRSSTSGVYITIELRNPNTALIRQYSEGEGQSPHPHARQRHGLPPLLKSRLPQGSPSCAGAYPVTHENRGRRRNRNRVSNSTPIMSSMPTAIATPIPTPTPNICSLCSIFEAAGVAPPEKWTSVLGQPGRLKDSSRG